MPMKLHLPNNMGCHDRVQRKEGDCRKAIEGRNPVAPRENGPYRT